jgi:hypothetical protein
VAGRERARVIDPDTQVIEIIDVGSLFGVMRIASASGLLSPKRLKSFTCSCGAFKNSAPSLHPDRIEDDVLGVTAQAPLRPVDELGPVRPGGQPASLKARDCTGFDQTDVLVIARSVDAFGHRPDLQ